MHLVVAGLLAGGATSLLVAPVPPVTQHVATMRTLSAASPMSDTQSSIFPAGSLLIADEAISPAKAKILAAKQAAAAKAAAGGYNAPVTEAGVSLGFNIDFAAGGAEADPFKEANELRDKIIELESQGKLSKAKSAQLGQYKTMEAQARDKANAAVRRAEEKAQEKARRAEESKTDDGSFVSKLSKVTGL